MRHYYFRLFLGVIFLVCGVFSLITMNFPFALFFFAFGGRCLYSAYTLWKKIKGGW